ncbi:FAD-dependent monooxygenase [Kitasatospora sp. NBC_01287]|uniref:FAD-dependent monooxygenase n=1 Tax=Kitasatospora sp. NBC_01287 TaxID=2903573 RepID=UPI00225A7194|nr:FAD-dependent monooxygenase [Kitasatospora sp. NBC_01287]MCX4751109.1 FAD-dependent monooxygenase [Kitasatospora sp. NBC_01287]
MNDHHPVIVVGGGIVGLTASLALSRLGVPSLLVEAHASTHAHPRARSVNARAMEVFRDLGVADAVRAAGAALAPAQGLYCGATLAEAIGPLQRRDSDESSADSASPPPLPGAQPSIFAPAAVARWSPTTGVRATLDVVEPVLLAAARKGPGELRFHTRCHLLEQDATGLRVRLEEVRTGAVREATADYLIAADGAGGGLRHQLGVSSTQGASHGHQLNVLFRADLHRFVQRREFSIVLIRRPDLHGMLTSIDNHSRWALHIRYDTAVERPEDYPAARCADLVRSALGLPAPDLRVLSVLPWEARERTLDRLRDGRVFFVGDAAHQMPPAGARGAGTGVADVHNLAWKLAAALDGRAGDRLLDSYHDERHPAAVRAVAASGANARDLTPDGAAAMAGRWAALESQGLGERYRSAAVLAGPEDPIEHGAEDLDGSPGTRVPHSWAPDGRSTVDLPDGGWILLGPACWQRAAAAHGLRHADPGPDIAARAALGGTGALLVRPDGHIAWRTREATADPAALLGGALAALPCAVRA